jgi:hypothetical protein
MPLQRPVAGWRKAPFGLMVLGGVAFAPWAEATDAPKPTPTVSELVVIAHRAPTVSELGVIARAECLQPKAVPGSSVPEVVSTYPRQGERVRPGLLILRVTFDQPMACSGFILFSGNRNPCSQVKHLPASSAAQDLEQLFLMSFDRKSIRVACFVEPGNNYTFQLFNPGFESLQDRWLEHAHPVDFTTSDASPIQTIPDALSADPETVLANVYRPARERQETKPTAFGAPGSR